LLIFTGVKELFEQEPPPPTKKTRGELMREIDADYYGYRDDDDGILIPREQEHERKGKFTFILIKKKNTSLLNF